MNTTSTEGPRAEHLAWCKQRALEYCAANDPRQAMAGFLSDMRKHSETRDHVALGLMMELSIAGHLNSNSEMRKFIEGFN